MGKALSISGCITSILNVCSEGKQNTMYTCDILQLVDLRQYTFLYNRHLTHRDTPTVDLSIGISYISIRTLPMSTGILTISIGVLHTHMYRNTTVCDSYNKYREALDT